MGAKMGGQTLDHVRTVILVIGRNAARRRTILASLQHNPAFKKELANALIRAP